uniref:BTB domain-containing protein n=1 Tax=Photinus pyralis TaxID=7054 RepID=A0A1Y1MR24_PHOPY
MFLKGPYIHTLYSSSVLAGRRSHFRKIGRLVAKRESFDYRTGEMNDNVEIIRSNKGGLKLIHRGYMYTVHKKRQGGGIRWRCTQRSLHCKGSISTGNGPPTVNMPHNHIPDPHSVALARCRQVEEFPDITSMLETECEDVKDNIQRMVYSAPHVQIPTTSDGALQSQPLSPTKLKVLRQNSSKCYLNKSVSESVSHLPPEEVCLRWNSHHSNMQSSFPRLLEKEQYVDVTLIADGQSLKCHRMILSSCSAYFEDILSDITPTQHPVIILKSTPYWILRALIDFMYAGEVNIDQNRLPELLDVAELLKIKGLAGKNSADQDQSIKQEDLQESIVKEDVVKSSSPTKAEDAPISDPLELLQPKFLDDPIMKNKDKSLPRKIFTKKIRKRKASDGETASPPLFPMRRGTRSRPNVKVPRYYDYEDIVKPSTSDSQPESPGVTIKSEPLDIDEHEPTFLAENSDGKATVTAKPKAIEKKPIKTEELKPEQLYKIKIKCLASLSESSANEREQNDSDPLDIDADTKNNDILSALEIIKIDCSAHTQPKTAESEKPTAVEIVSSTPVVDESEKEAEEK